MRDAAYVVGRHITERGDAAAVRNAVLDAVGSRLASATVDAYSDFHDCGYSVVVDLLDGGRHRAWLS